MGPQGSQPRNIDASGGNPRVQLNESESEGQEER